MQNRIRSVLRVGGLLISLAVVALAQQTTSFELTGVEGASLGGVYTSPYYATVGGQADLPVICDDFADDSYLDESWTVYETSLASLVLGDATVPPLWQNGYSVSLASNQYVFTQGGLKQAQAYTVAAYLAEEILGATPGSANQQDLSYAMWALFDEPAALSASYISGSNLTNAEQDLLTAEQMVSTEGLTPASFPNVVIYSYDSKFGTSCGGGGSCPPPPQEFIGVSAAEPPSAAVLGADLLGVVGLIAFLRRRATRVLN